MFNIPNEIINKIGVMLMQDTGNNFQIYLIPKENGMTDKTLKFLSSEDAINEVFLDLGKLFDNSHKTEKWYGIKPL